MIKLSCVWHHMVESRSTSKRYYSFSTIDPVEDLPIPIEVPPEHIHDGKVTGCVYQCLAFSQFSPGTCKEGILQDREHSRICACDSRERCNRVTCSQRGLDRLKSNPRGGGGGNRNRAKDHDKTSAAAQAEGGIAAIGVIAIFLVLC